MKKRNKKDLIQETEWFRNISKSKLYVIWNSRFMSKIKNPTINVQDDWNFGFNFIYRIFLFLIRSTIILNKFYYDTI